MLTEVVCDVNRSGICCSVRPCRQCGEGVQHACSTYRHSGRKGVGRGAHAHAHAHTHSRASTTLLLRPPPTHTPCIASMTLQLHTPQTHHASMTQLIPSPSHTIHATPMTQLLHPLCCPLGSVPLWPSSLCGAWCVCGGPSWRACSAPGRQGPYRRCGA